MRNPDQGMQAEILEAPNAVRRQAVVLNAPLAALVERCRRTAPKFVFTCARGSSAHAATFAKHLIERHVGIPVGAAAPNIASVYRRRLDLTNQLLLTISQSGRSDDLVEYTKMANASGAITAALVNDLDSPLAVISEFALPMAAGPEISIAATKSFVATIAALLRLIGYWTSDRGLQKSVEGLPDRLEAATRISWSGALDALTAARSMVTIGRGPTLAIAREASLKLKETCDLHAEAFSSAEFQHGPMALITKHYPAMFFVPGDESASSVRGLSRDLCEKGASVLVVDHKAVHGIALPTLAPDHPDADALCSLQTFYSMLAQLAQQRGVDSERPRHLKKVTRTR